MGDPILIPIADGVRLCAVQTDRFKTSKLLVTIALPLDGDIAARALLPFLLRRSCRAYPDFRSLNGRLSSLYGAALGAAVRKAGEAQVLELSLTSIDDRFALDGGSITADAAQLLCDLLFEPNLDENGCFPADTVEAEKRLLLERMRSEDDEKAVYARRRCQEIMCENEAFGRNRYGTQDEILSITPARVYDAWRDALERAHIQITMCAGSGIEQTASLLRGLFEKVQRNVLPIETQFVPTAGDVKYVRETQPLMQGTLVLGFRCGTTSRDDMDPAICVTSDMFGGGTYSKLFTVVREKMSLCYFCRAQLNRDKGIMIVSSGIETENEEKAREAILQQLQEMREGKFTREEFDASIRSLSDTILGYTDSPDVICGWYALQIFRDTFKTPAQRIAEFAAVTPEEIRPVAEKITLDTVFMLAGTGENDHA